MDSERCKKKRSLICIARNCLVKAESAMPHFEGMYLAA